MASIRSSKRKRNNPFEEEEENDVQQRQQPNLPLLLHLNQNHQQQHGRDYAATASWAGLAAHRIGTRVDLSPVVVFAHGAGAPSSSEWMVKWKDMLSKAINAVEVVTFDYPYIVGGKRKGPPKAETLVEFHSDVVKKAMAKYPEHPLILIGKSMGSRVSCMVAVREDIGASAIICLGYPLKSPKGELRDETLLQLTLPVMFVQGSKDWLCPLEKLESVRRKMVSLNDLHVIEGGDHSFQIAKKHLQMTGFTQEGVEALAVLAIARFVSCSLTKR